MPRAAATVSFVLFLLSTTTFSQSSGLEKLVVRAKIPNAETDGAVAAILLIEPQRPLSDRPNTAQSADQTTRLEVQIPGTIEVPRSLSGTFRLQLKSQGYWARDLVVDGSDQESQISIRVFATAELHMKLRVTGKSSIPQTVDASFAPVPKYVRPTGKEVPEGLVTCPVIEMVATCEIPAGDIDLRVETVGAAPIYQWGLSLEPHKSYNLQDFELVAGGSIAGFVMDQSDNPIDGVEVEINVQSAASQNTSPIIGERLQRLTRKSTTNNRGFFQVVGVVPGVYFARALKDGFSPARSDEPIAIRGDLEERLTDSLVLGPPASLEVLIDPPVDPFGEPWKVQLLSVNMRSRDTGSARDGYWIRSGIDPGSYILLVLASDGSRWSAEEIEVEAGEQSRPLEIPVIHVIGRVERDGEAVQGTLSLIRREKGAQLDFELGEDGEFEGYLCDEGKWEGQVEIAGSSFRRLVIALKPLTIQPQPGKREVELLIEIPDTRLEGIVVNANGEPAPEAQILLFNSDFAPNSEIFTDANGEFEISGLPEGEVDLLAQWKDQSSDFNRISLSEDLLVPRLRLVLRKDVRYAGQLVAADGLPLPGANIVAWPVTASPYSSLSRTVTTDIDGSFVLNLPETPQVDLLIQAQGLPRKFRREQIDLDEPMIIVLDDQEGGTLSFDFSERSPQQTPGSRSEALLITGGVELPLEIVSYYLSPRTYSNQFVGVLELVNMAGDSYVLCYTESRSGGTLRAGGGRSTENCETLELTPGGSVSFEMPSSEANESVLGSETAGD